MPLKIILAFIIVSFVCLFLYTGIIKLANYHEFMEEVAVSPLLRPVSNIVSATLPILEITIAVMLMFSKWRLNGLYLTFGLMVIFTGYLLANQNMADNKALTCSCGGVIEELPQNVHISLNLLLIALSLTGVVLGRKSVSRA